MQPETRHSVLIIFLFPALNNWLSGCWAIRPMGTWGTMDRRLQEHTQAKQTHRSMSWHRRVGDTSPFPLFQTSANFLINTGYVNVPSRNWRKGPVKVSGSPSCAPVSRPWLRHEFTRLLQPVYFWESEVNLKNRRVTLSCRWSWRVTIHFQACYLKNILTWPSMTPGNPELSV